VACEGLFTEDEPLNCNSIYLEEVSPVANLKVKAIDGLFPIVATGICVECAVKDEKQNIYGSQSRLKEGFDMYPRISLVKYSFHSSRWK